jgi:putative flippase GtrA
VTALSSTDFQRWLKFNAVGLIGAGVQILVLQGLVKLGVHYLLATALAVETAILHNYIWHIRWTWRGRAGSLWRFHLGNGLVSLISNIALMRLFGGWMGVPVVPANIAAIVITSVLNFLIGDRWVFSLNGRPSGSFHRSL